MTDTKQIKQLHWITSVWGLELLPFIEHLCLELHNAIPEEHQDTIRLSLDMDYLHRPAVRVDWERPLTDEEYKRLYGLEDHQKAQRRAQYEELKKEFGNE